MLIKVIHADDHLILREGLHALASKVPDIHIVASARTGDEAIDLAKKLKPDLMLMDVWLPVVNGIHATREIVSKNAAIKVLMLSGHSEWHQVHLSLQAGASGYLLKSASSAEIFSAIRQVYAGQLAFSPSVARVIQQTSVYSCNSGKDRLQNVTLSPRESQVLCLIVNGYDNKSAANEIGVSVKTLEKHRQRIMDKLNLHDVVALTRFAITAGIVRPDLRSLI